jgi:hypothetical protein
VTIGNGLGLAGDGVAWRVFVGEPIAAAEADGDAPGDDARPLP